MNKVIGIDLGTTNTCAAFVSNKIPRVVPIEGGFNIMPSVVTLHQSGNVFVGQAAKEYLTSQPERTIYAVKRLLGRQYDAQSIEQLKRRLSYRIVPGPDGEAAIEVDGKVHSCSDILGRILSQVKRYAEIHMGEEIPDAVIAVPAYYSDHQRVLVKRAGTLAGWNVRRIINEPTAAALAYGFNRGFDQTVLVYDMGGGTFDVSILELTGNIFQVIATGGDTFLGGADFDNRIVEWILDRLLKDHKIDVAGSPAALERVRAAAERAKIELSILAHTQVRIPGLVDRRGKSIDIELTLDRKTLNDCTKDLITRSLEVVDRVLSEKGLGKANIHELILVGGQTRMPLLLDMLTAHFGRPPRKGVHPDECVALGAALLGDSLAKIDAVTLLDTVSVPIGVARPTGMLDIVVEKFVRLPHKASIVLPTTEHNQTSLVVDVYQGEPGPVSRAEYLGSLKCDKLPPAPAGQLKVTLEFNVDNEGLLTVHVSNNQSTGSEVVTLSTVKRMARPRDVIEEHSGARPPEELAPANQQSGERAGLRGLVRSLWGNKGEGES